MSRKTTKRHFYSRLAKTEQKRNLLRLFVFGALSLGLLILIFSRGLSVLANLAFFVSQSRKSGVTPTPSPVFLSPPILAPLPSATNSAQIKLTGFSQKETMIEIFLNEESQGESKTDNQGQFEKTVTLNKKENEIYGVTQDFLGNCSNPSGKIKIIFDQEPPELTIVAPEEGKRFYQEQNRTVEIRGQTEPEASLYFNDHLLILNSNGNFNTHLKLKEGENLLKFLVRDPAGNQTEKEVRVFYQP